MCELSKIKETIDIRMSIVTGEANKEQKRTEIGLDIISCQKMKLISGEQSKELINYLYSI